MAKPRPLWAAWNGNPAPDGSPRSHDQLPVINPYRQHDKKDEFDAILREHDYGVFRRSAALVDEVLTDDRCQGVLSARIGSVLASPIKYEPAGPKTKHRKVAELFGGADGKRGLWEDMCSRAAKSEVIKWGITMGVGYGRWAVDTSDPTKWMPRLVPWHPQWLRWDWNRRCFMAQTVTGEEALPRPDEQPRSDGKWLIWCPYTVENGWKNGLIRALGPKYLSRQWNERDLDRWCERQGLGIIKAYVPSSSQPGQREEFFDQVDNIGNEAIVFCSPGADGKRESGFDVDKVEFEARTWEGIKARREMLDTDIAVLVNGQNLTTEVKEGSRAAAEVHEVRTIDKALLDASFGLAERSQGMSWYCQWNLGDPELAPTPIYQVEPPDDELGETQALKNLGEGVQQLVLAEPRVNTAAIMEAHGVPLFSEEEMEALAAVELEGGGTGGGGADIPPSVQAAIMTVNEARALIGLGPMLLDDGGPDPDGKLTVAEFQATYAEIADAAAKGDGGSEDGPPPPAALSRKVEMARALSAVLAAARSPAPRRAALQALEIRKRYNFAGLQIAVEHPAGTVRTWVGPAGEGHTRMQYDYGFIEGYLSGDDEEIDCYIGPFEAAPDVFVVHQLLAPECRRWDEDKVMLGFATADDAKAAYLGHRDDGARCFGGMLILTLEQFKARLRRRRPETTAKIRASRDVEASVALRRTSAGERRASGFREQLAEKARDMAARALGPLLEAITAEIDSASSIEDARRRVLQRYRKSSPPKELAEILARTTILSKMAGLKSGRESL